MRGGIWTSGLNLYSSLPLCVEPLQFTQILALSVEKILVSLRGLDVFVDFLYYYVKSYLVNPKILIFNPVDYLSI